MYFVRAYFCHIYFLILLTILTTKWRLQSDSVVRLSAAVWAVFAAEAQPRDVKPLVCTFYQGKPQSCMSVEMW